MNKDKLKSIISKKANGDNNLSAQLYQMYFFEHIIKSFPNPDKSSLEGIDATISGGWLDLRAKNETNDIYQIDISFDDEYMYGRILSNKKPTVDYKIINEDLHYVEENDKIFECVSVVRVQTDKQDKSISNHKKLYDEKVFIEYELPEDVVIKKILKKK